MTPSTPRADIKDRINGIKGTRLDEHGNDGIVQTANTVGCPQGISNVPVV